MEEFRITLISDPTKEFPDNQNNKFKVRLPSLIDLPGDTWKASLWSLSVPDEGHHRLRSTYSSSHDFLYLH